MSETKTASEEKWKLYLGDSCEVLKQLSDESVNCCITSPPYYGLRDYGYDGQIGLEDTPEEYIKKLVDVFREVRRVLTQDGTCWINIGDSYNTSATGSITSEKQLTNRGANSNLYTKKIVDSCKPKDLIGIPWMLAFALREDGWYLRQDIIWSKPNPMPESVKDRCTKSHEYIFLLSKSQRYYFDSDSISETASPDNCVRDRDNTKMNNTPGRTKMGGLKTNTYETRNKRDVWTVTVGGGYSDENHVHYATYPRKLIEPCVLSGCPKNGVVLDPFNGTGTTGSVAIELQRKYIGIDMSKEYIEMSTKRLERESSQCCLFDDEYGVA